MTTKIENNQKKIEEKDILNFLFFRRERLIDELDKVNQTIDVLNSSRSVLTINNNSELKPLDNGPTNSLHKMFTSSIPPLKPLSNYEKKAKLDGKIAFTLSEIEKGTKEDILNYIIKKEPELDKLKLKPSLSVRLSILLREGRIIGKKDGKSYTYSLI